MTQQVINVLSNGDPLVIDLYRQPDADAPPVMLLHGWGGSGQYWQPTIERLRSRYALIVPDLPGVGRSMPVAKARSIFDQVEALEELFEQLEIRKVRLVGHSMGAAISILLADKRPELVESLVLVGISLFRDDTERAQFNVFAEMASMVMRLRTPLFAELPILTRLFAQRFFYTVPDDDELLRDGFLDYLNMDYATATACMRSSTDPRINLAAARLQMPTLLVVSRNDQIMPVSNVPDTVATIPDCELRWIEKSGHLPMVEHADLFAEIVDQFLMRPTSTYVPS